MCLSVTEKVQEGNENFERTLYRRFLENWIAKHVRAQYKIYDITNRCRSGNGDEDGSD